jgi:2-polyprenyl-6-methoxyphenol hydroxylase-like FAD-dependent oxidoreductase
MYDVIFTYAIYSFLKRGGMTSPNTSETVRSGRQAVVIGGSVAGLLASRILSDHFERVILIERDKFTDNAEPRKGAPQARHAHAVLAKAVLIIEDLLPGFFADLEAAGSTKIDMCNELKFYHFGKWKKRFSGGIYSYFQTRTFLEWKLRQRIGTIANITFMDGTDVSQFTTDAAKTRITGVKIRRDGEEPQEVTADLVVDAGGRGSRTPQWLEALGYPKVEELVLKVDIAYSTRFFKRTKPDPAPWKSLFIYPKLPDKRLGVILPTEDPEKWLVTLGGVFGDHPPTDDAGFLEYARSLPVPDLYNVIKDLEPAGPVLVYKMPSNLRHRYELMPRFPDGLVVLGDALCSFNPIYGQGMTTAALDSLALGECLREQLATHPNGELTGLSVKFQKKAAAVIANPWLMATAEDMRYDEFPDPISPMIRFLHWFTGRVHMISDKDELSAFRFTQAMNMLRPPWALFDPRVVWRALTARSASG